MFELKRGIGWNFILYRGVSKRQICLKIRLLRIPNLLNFRHLNDILQRQKRKEKKKRDIRTSFQSFNECHVTFFGDDHIKFIDKMEYVMYTVELKFAFEIM